MTSFRRIAAGLFRQPRARKPIVLPFTVLVDQRERLPYTFTGLPPRNGRPVRLAGVERRYLATGDYTIAGCEDRFAVERKSLEDLYATLGQDRPRFRREIERLDAMQFAAIVIEATLAEIRDPAACRQDWRSRLSPASVEGTMVAWSVRYPRVHWWPVGDRPSGELRVVAAMEKFWKHKHEAAEAAGEEKHG